MMTPVDHLPSATGTTTAMLNTKYVLITPARNEDAFIEKTLASMVAQTVLPQRWVIVDDGSKDRTVDIVQTYASRFTWIDLVRREPRLHRHFAGKVEAFNAGDRKSVV